MTTSSMIDVKRRLVELLAARPELATVEVAYAWPGPNTRNEALFFGEAAEGTSTVPTIAAGRKQRQEDYDLELVAWVFMPGNTGAPGAEAAEVRAFQLMESVDNLLADNPRLGTAYLQWARLGAFESRLAVNDKGWACAHSRTIHVGARLT